MWTLNGMMETCDGTELPEFQTTNCFVQVLDCRRMIVGVVNAQLRLQFSLYTT